MNTQIKGLEEILDSGGAKLPEGWGIKLIKSDECLSYVAWNEQSREGLVVDPKIEDWDAYVTLTQALSGYSWLGVIDTHTHADHISAAARLAKELKAPLIMHEKAPSRKVQLRVSAAEATLPSKASYVRLLHTPGHTQDSITVVWGPFLFGGDTILYGDTGRDDLPGGDPVAHYESVQKIKDIAVPEMIVLPGHDHKNGRASSWGTQLKINPSLTQAREDFIREASAFSAPAPKLLKESLRVNFQ